MHNYSHKLHIYSHKLAIIAVLIQLSGAVPDHGAKVIGEKIIHQQGTQLNVEIKGHQIIIKAL